jgi:hypothetical protein
MFLVRFSPETGHGGECPAPDLPHVGWGWIAVGQWLSIWTSSAYAANTARMTTAPCHVFGPNQTGMPNSFRPNQFFDTAGSLNRLQRA